MWARSCSDCMRCSRGLEEPHQHLVPLTPEPLSDAEKLTVKLLSLVAMGHTMLSMAGGVVSTRNAAVLSFAILPRRSLAVTVKL